MVRVGGVSWNPNSANSKGGVKTRFSCEYCGRGYKMEWAKDNHEKNCPLNE